jgi:hypothetical protein
MREYNSRDIIVLDPRINNPNTGVVNDNDRVIAFRRDVSDECIAIFIRQAWTIGFFGCVAINKYQTDVRRWIDIRILGIKVPNNRAPILVRLTPERIDGTIHICRGVRTRATAHTQCTILDCRSTRGFVI